MRDLTLVGVATCAIGRTKVTPPEAARWCGGEGGIPPSTMVPPGDIIGRRRGNPPGRVIGGEMTGEGAGAAATTPGEMGYCWGLSGNRAGCITWPYGVAPPVAAAAGMNC